MEMSEIQLLERWHRHGDAEAFSTIVTSHADMVYATCRRVLHDPLEAEDAAQECFESLMRNGAAVRKSLGGWLHTTAVHRCLDRIKSEKRRRTREEG